MQSSFVLFQNVVSSSPAPTSSIRCVVKSLLIHSILGRLTCATVVVNRVSWHYLVFRFARRPYDLVAVAAPQFGHGSARGQAECNQAIPVLVVYALEFLCAFLSGVLVCFGRPPLRLHARCCLCPFASVGLSPTVCAIVGRRLASCIDLCGEPLFFPPVHQEAPFPSSI